MANPCVVLAPSGVRMKADTPVKDVRMGVLADVIDVPLKDWPERCHEIAGRMQKAGYFADGLLSYGLWTGPIAEGSTFAGRPICRHGWVEMPDGSIVDPTRWAFEDVEPYMYVGPSDYYDFGGNEMRSRTLGPMPRFPEAPYFNVPLIGPAAAFVENLLKFPVIALGQNHLFWLANQPLAFLGEYAEPIYRALEALSMLAFVPFDNRTRVFGESQEQLKKL